MSLRFSCAVNPFAAHAATPSDPLPSGSDWLSEVFGAPSTMSDSATTPDGFNENEPFCQAVVTVAAAAGPHQDSHRGQRNGQRKPGRHSQETQQREPTRHEGLPDRS